jgi:hypothetical protein
MAGFICKGLAEIADAFTAHVDIIDCGSGVEVSQFFTRR